MRVILGLDGVEVEQYEAIGMYRITNTRAAFKGGATSVVLTEAQLTVLAHSLAARFPLTEK